MKYVLDTSVVVEGRISPLIESGEIRGTIIIPEAVIAELEAQANFGKMSGFQGLEEIRKIRELAKKYGFNLIFCGDRPKLEHIRLARGGEIDNLIRDVAEKEDAILITSDRVQYAVAIAKGIKSIYLKKEKIKPESTRIMSYFTPDTASVHLREGVPPYAKRGKIGELELVKLDEKPLTLEELRGIAHEILESARQDDDSSIEIEREGATIVQLREIRIAIAEKPFADRMEITAVRPIAKVSLDDYGVSEELKKRFVERQRGILIAGPPGAGKSTFAASVANFLLENGYIVKTMESPRDLMVRDEITQYSPLEGNMALTADVLLLVRPDYTIYDEVRKTSDFQVFADMRLAGVGMIGVTHATRAIDAIQRMIGRVELGVIPQVVDTVIFIDGGKIKKIYELKFTVKIPHGMVEADLARPVIEVIDFETKKTEYEIYTYGEQVVVMPVKEGKNFKIVENAVENKIRDIVSVYKINAISEKKVIVSVPENEISHVLGRKGRRIKSIEEELGVSIQIEPLKSDVKEYEARVEERGKYFTIYANDLKNEKVDVYIGDKYLFTAEVGKKGIIRVRKDREVGREIRLAMLKGEKIKLIPLRV